MTVRIALVGDYNAQVLAHQAIPPGIQLAADTLRTSAAIEWVPTLEITDASRLARFDGIWCVPASPYRSMEGALLAIRFARESATPFLGTCGGFQHAVVEFARNVAGWTNAQHAEEAPHAERRVVTPLSCALVEVSDEILLVSGTRIAAAYGRTPIVEGYHCRYGINPECLEHLVAKGFCVAAQDRAGDVRALELPAHPFYVATLFQPERAALKGVSPPLVAAFIKAAGAASAARTTP